MKTTLLIAALALAAPAAYAAEPPAAPEQAEPPVAPEQAQRDLREGLEKMLHAIEGLVKSIPMYEAPTINENGDIIIRRKHPAPEKREPDTQQNDSNRT